MLNTRDIFVFLHVVKHTLDISTFKQNNIMAKKAPFNDS